MCNGGGYPMTYLERIVRGIELYNTTKDGLTDYLKQLVLTLFVQGPMVKFMHILDATKKKVASKMCSSNW